MTTPERIWVKGSQIDYEETRWHTSQWNGGTEYVHRDPAVLAELPEVQSLVAEERERCAKVAEAHDYSIQSSTAADIVARVIAAAIREIPSESGEGRG